MWAVDWWALVTSEGPAGSAGAQDVGALHGTFLSDRYCDACL